MGEPNAISAIDIRIGICAADGEDLSIMGDVDCIDVVAIGRLGVGGEESELGGGEGDQHQEVEGGCPEEEGLEFHRFQYIFKYRPLYNLHIMPMPTPCWLEDRQPECSGL